MLRAAHWKTLKSIAFAIAAAVVCFTAPNGVSASPTLARPTDIARAPDGSAWWVTDSFSSMLLKLSPSGVVTNAYDAHDCGVRLNNPQAVSVDASGNVYVADTNNSRIVVFDQSGAVVRVIGSDGTEPGRLRYPCGVAVSDSGEIWVADTVNDRLQRFGSDGVPRSVISTLTGVTGGATVPLNRPRGLWVSGSSVYVADAVNRRIVKLRASDGRVEAIWGITEGTKPDLPTTSRYVAPLDVWAGPVHSYVVDMGLSKIERVDSLIDTVTASWGSYGDGPLSFKDPQGVWSDGSSVWVADTGNSRITKFTLNGQFVESWLVLAPAQADQIPDTRAPVTESNVTAAWRASDMLVNLWAADDRSGVRDISYRVGAMAWRSVAGSTASFLVSSQGENVVEFYATDIAGNREPTRTVVVRIDKTAPITSAEVAGSPLDLLRTVSIKSVDGLSGVSRLYYQVGSGQWQSVESTTVNLSLLVEDQVTVNFYAVDLVGNVEPTKTLTIYRDMIPPVTSASADTSWSRFSRTVSLTATDTGSGVDALFYKIGDGSWSVVRAAETSFVVSREGETVVWFYAVDRAGNAENPQSLVVRIDTTPPRTLSLGDAAEWTSRSATVALEAYDGASGVAEIRYRIGTGTWRTYQDPLFVGEEGENEIQYYAVDLAGNTEPTRTAYVRIDRTPPSTVADAPSEWRSTSVTVTLHAADALSGVRLTQYRVGLSPLYTYLGPFVVSAEGRTDITFHSVDAAGNSEMAKSVTVRIDRTPPTTVLRVGDLTPEGRRLVSLEATDTGVGGVTTYYSVNGSPAQAYTDAIAVAPYGGGSLIEFWSIDALGNEEVHRSHIVREDDLEPPLTTATGLDGNWCTTSVTVTLEATDAASGVRATYYRVGESGAVTTYTAPFTVDTEGETKVTYWSVDASGLREADKIGWVRIDRTPPVSSASALVNDAGTAATVTISATDAGSGVQRVEYRIDGGAWTTYAGPFTVGPSGVRTISYRAIDSAGNTEATRELKAYVDRTPPASSASGLDGVWRSAPVTVTLNATDQHTAVAEIRYRLAGETGWQVYSEPFVVGAEGETIVQYYAVDLAGNTEPLRSGVVRIDRGAPLTVSSVTGTWRSTSETVTLIATDDRSGVGVIRYRISGSAWTTYTAPFVIDAEGETTVQYQAVDRAGNTEPLRSGVVRIDRTPPTTSVQTMRAAGGGLVVSLNAQDGAGSGIASIAYQVGDEATWTPYTGPFTLRGAARIRFAARDVAGNQEPVRTWVVLPSTTVNRSNTTWYRSAVSISLTATHPADAPLITYYRLHGATTTLRYAGPFTITADGIYSISYWSVADDVDEPVKTLTLHIDKTAPTIASLSSPTHPSPSRVYRSRNVRVTWRGYDRTSGVARYAIKLDRYPTSVPSTKSTTTATSRYYTNLASGTWYFHVRAQDKAGNWGPTRHFKVRIR